MRRRRHYRRRSKFDRQVRRASRKLHGAGRYAAFHTARAGAVLFFAVLRAAVRR